MELTKVLIEEAVQGGPQAARTLVLAITPVIHARVGRALLRRRSAAQNRDMRQEVEDLTQQVLLVLFADQGHALRQWEPARGLSLSNYVGLLAEREVFSILRSGRQSPWANDPTPDEELNQSVDGGPVPEHIVASREVLAAVLDDVCSRLSEQGMQMFQWLIVDERSAEEICTITGMKPGAVYVWKTRIVQMLRQVADKLMLESLGDEPAGR